jgi:arsenite methyltransferase
VSDATDLHEKMWDRIKDQFLKTVASQLGRPTGVPGRIVARVLNHGNRSTIVAAIDAIDPEDGQVIADIGFGGGVGLELLLDRVGKNGKVYGVEISPTMLVRAGRRFHAEIDTGRLVLHNAGMDRLLLADASLDGLISTNTVYFIDDLAPAFAELARVLRPSGRMVLGIGDPARMAKMPFTKHQFRLRPVDHITATLDNAGFQTTEDRRLGDGDEAFHLLICRRRETR